MAFIKRWKVLAEVLKGIKNKKKKKKKREGWKRQRKPGTSLNSS